MWKATKTWRWHSFQKQTPSEGLSSQAANKNQCVILFCSDLAWSGCIQHSTIKVEARQDSDQKQPWPREGGVSKHWRVFLIAVYFWYVLERRISLILAKYWQPQVWIALQSSDIVRLTFSTHCKAVPILCIDSRVNWSLQKATGWFNPSTTWWETFHQLLCSLTLHGTSWNDFAEGYLLDSQSCTASKLNHGLHGAIRQEAVWGILAVKDSRITLTKRPKPHSHSDGHVWAYIAYIAWAPFEFRTLQSQVWVRGNLGTVEGCLAEHPIIAHSQMFLVLKLTAESLL